jgi:hypothetical protein
LKLRSPWLIPAASSIACHLDRSLYRKELHGYHHHLPRASTHLLHHRTLGKRSYN